MEGIRSYLLAVVAVGILCSVAETLGPQKGVNQQLIKTLCGVIMLLTAFGPVLKLSYRDAVSFFPDISASGQAAAEQGTLLAREALEAGIKQRTEAYILDKAASYDAQLEVEVKIKWTDIPVPAGVVISGDCSPYAKSQLSAMMARDLGIPTEEQQWQT